MKNTIALLSLLSLTSGIACAENQRREFEENDLIAFSDNASETSNSSNPPSSLSISRTRGIGLVAFGDYLYWKAAEEGLAYGLQSVPAGSAYKGIFGKPSRIHPGWESGYRLGLAYDIPHDQWDVSFTWTRYCSDAKNHIEEKPGETVFTFWTDLNFNPVAKSAHAKWELSFNVLDLSVSRPFSLGENFQLIPFAGFKAAWINQELFVNYENITISTGPTAPNIISKNRNNFQGYGIEIGTTAAWDLWKGLYLFGKFEGGLLLGQYKIAQFESEPDSPRTELTDSVKEVAPVLAMQGGIGWKYQFNSNRMFVKIHAGWEEQLWFNQNQLSRFIEAFNEGMVKSQRGDLTFAGWTVGAMLGF